MGVYSAVCLSLIRSRTRAAYAGVEFKAYLL